MFDEVRAYEKVSQFFGTPCILFGNQVKCMWTWCRMRNGWESNPRSPVATPNAVTTTPPSHKRITRQQSWPIRHRACLAARTTVSRSRRRRRARSKCYNAIRTGKSTAAVRPSVGPPGRSTASVTASPVTAAAYAWPGPRHLDRRGGPHSDARFRRSLHVARLRCPDIRPSSHSDTRPPPGRPLLDCTGNICTPSRMSGMGRMFRGKKWLYGTFLAGGDSPGTNVLGLPLFGGGGECSIFPVFILIGFMHSPSLTIAPSTYPLCFGNGLY